MKHFRVNLIEITKLLFYFRPYNIRIGGGSIYHSLDFVTIFSKARLKRNKNLIHKVIIHFKMRYYFLFLFNNNPF